MASARRTESLSLGSAFLGVIFFSTGPVIVANAEMQSIPAERAFNHYVTGEAVPEAHMYSPEGNRYFFPQLTAMACAGTAELTDENRVGTCPAHKRGLGESFATRMK